MTRAAVVVVLLSASLLLAGCSSEPAAPAPPTLAKSTVDANSAPAFLTTSQTASDQIGPTVAGVQSDSTRYQGTVHGTKIYLGLDLGNHVEIIHRLSGGWAQGGSGGGNTVFEAGLPHGDSVQYVPQGATAKTLAGWVPLSKYIIVKQS
jgi:hypothetical protein